MQDFRNLRVWHSGRDFCVALYDVTRGFPSDERFGLTSQMRRSARSICANIAEGCAYSGGNDSARFFQISLGSSCESLSDMLIARELGFLAKPKFDRLEDLLEPTRKQLVRLIERSRVRR